MLKYSIEPFHHTICYVSNNNKNDEVQKFIDGKFNYNNDIFKESESNLLHQCNGVVGSIVNQALFIVIPVDYLPTNDDTYLQKWINDCNNIGFTDITFEGLFDMTVIPESRYSNFKKIPIYLSELYDKPISNLAYLVTIAPQKITRMSLIYVSLLRTVYVSYYRGIIEKYHELVAKYPDVEKFKLFLFAIRVYSNYNDYSKRDNGGYHLVSQVQRYRSGYVYMKFDSLEQYLKHIYMGYTINSCSQKIILGSHMENMKNKINEAQFTKLLEEENFIEEGLHELKGHIAMMLYDKNTPELVYFYRNVSINFSAFFMLLKLIAS